MENNKKIDNTSMRKQWIRRIGCRIGTMPIDADGRRIPTVESPAYDDRFLRVIAWDPSRHKGDCIETAENYIPGSLFLQILALDKPVDGAGIAARFEYRNQNYLALFNDAHYFQIDDVPDPEQSNRALVAKFKAILAEHGKKIKPRLDALYHDHKIGIKGEDIWEAGDIMDDFVDAFKELELTREDVNRFADIEVADIREYAEQLRRSRIANQRLLASLESIESKRCRIMELMLMGIAYERDTGSATPFDKTDEALRAVSGGYTCPKCGIALPAYLLDEGFTDHCIRCGHVFTIEDYKMEDNDDIK